MSRRTPAPIIDTLESRRLLAASSIFAPVVAGTVNSFTTVITGAATSNGSNKTITFTDGASAAMTKTGTLVVKGTDAADAITVKSTGKGAAVTIGSRNIVFPSGVKRLLVEANGGDDHVDVSGFIRPSTVSGGGGDDVLVGARATNLIGGSGDDKLVASQTPDVIDFSVSGQTMSQYGDVRPSVLSGGAGNDTLVAQGADSVIGGGGNDTFVGMTSTPGTIDASKPDAIEDFFHTTQGVAFSGTELFQLRVTT